MNEHKEELIYEEKIDRITELIEELVLDAMLAALQKIRERYLLFSQMADKAENPREPF